MFIHLGADIVVCSHDIIAIIDYGKKGIEGKIYPFIHHYEQQGKMVWISKPSTKSIVITDEYIYGSPISSLTLNKRV